MALDSLGLSRGVLEQGGDCIATVRAEVELRDIAAAFEKVSTNAARLVRV